MSIVVSFVLSLHPSNFSIQAGFLKEAKGLQRGNKNPAGPDDLTHILREEKSKSVAWRKPFWCPQIGQGKPPWIMSTNASILFSTLVARMLCQDDAYIPCHKQSPRHPVGCRQPSVETRITWAAAMSRSGVLPSLMTPGKHKITTTPLCRGLTQRNNVLGWRVINY